MSEHQARSARDDVYDHEHDEPRPGRRRRQVADWGVGDDVFDHMPRNRFSRAAEGPSRERRSAVHDVAERSAAAEHRAAAPESEPATHDESPRGRAGDGRRTIQIGRPEDVPSEIAAITADRDLSDVEEPAPAREQPERRTVKIAGRPEGSLEAARFHREHGSRRPSRTAHERIGTRPDRLAMWAVALGMLLILIAILTAL